MANLSIVSGIEIRQIQSSSASKPDQQTRPKIRRQKWQIITTVQYTQQRGSVQHTAEVEALKNTGREAYKISPPIPSLLSSSAENIRKLRLDFQPFLPLFGTITRGSRPSPAHGRPSTWPNVPHNHLQLIFRKYSWRNPSQSTLFLF